LCQSPRAGGLRARRNARVYSRAFRAGGAVAVLFRNLVLYRLPDDFAMSAFDLE
jgi:hypothetical protein